MPPTIELDDFELSADEATTELNVGLITGSTAFTVASDASTSFNNSIDLGANAINNVGNIDVNEGNAIRDNGGTSRIQLRSADTKLNAEDGTTAAQLNSGISFAYYANSNTDWVVYDDEGGFNSFKYTSASSAPGTFELTNATLQMAGHSITQLGGTSDASSGTIRLANNTEISWRNNADTGDLDLRVNNGDDLISKMDGYFFRNTNAQNILTLNSNGNNDVRIPDGNLRIYTGQVIEDGSGTDRINIASNATSILAENGKTVYQAVGGVATRISGYSSQPIVLYDRESDSNAVVYRTDTSTGTLELPNAKLDAGGNNVDNASRFRFEDKDGDGSKWQINNTGDDAWLRVSAPGGVVGTFKPTDNVFDLSPSSWGLRIGTGQSIEDGGGTERFRVKSGFTDMLDENATRAFRADADGTFDAQIFSTQNFRLFDDLGNFNALQYSTTSSAPGTLELPNANLDMNDNRLLFASTLHMNAQSSAPQSAGTGQAFYWQSDGSGFGSDGDVIVEAENTAGSGDKSAVLYDYSADSVSSERFKKDITALEADPYDLLAVKTVTFTSDDSNEKRSHGFLAEDLYEAWGEKAVHTKVAEKDDDWIDEEYLDKHGFEWGDEVPHQPRNRAIITAHHAVIREQQEQIESLENRIEALEQKVAS